MKRILTFTTNFATFFDLSKYDSQGHIVSWSQTKFEG